MFKIVFTKLVQWLLPTWLRSEVITILVLASNYPLREAYNRFNTYCESVEYRLAHNYQVCYLQAMLNDTFDTVQRRIRIVDFTAYGSIYFFADEDNMDLFLGDEDPTFFYDDDTGFDFTIQIPTGIVTSESELAFLKAKMKQYKLAGKQYFIERI